VALQRGPVIFCIEDADQEAPVSRIRLLRSAKLYATNRPDLLGGVILLEGEALAAGSEDWDQTLYRQIPPGHQPVHIQAIPYYAWDNRQPGAMEVWIPEV
jgi:DUF1680 family protein